MRRPKLQGSVPHFELFPPRQAKALDASRPTLGLTLRNQSPFLWVWVSVCLEQIHRGKHADRE